MANDEQSNNKKRKDIFEDIVIQYEKKIFNLLYSLSGNIEEAKDSNQETFLRAFKGFRSFRKEAEIFTWLYRIAVNCWKNRLRYNLRHGITKSESLDVPELSEGLRMQLADFTILPPDEILARSELRDYLKKCISTLPEKYRVPLVLYIRNTSCEEIARVLHCRMGTVKSLLYRARLMLKDKLIIYLK